jgi:ABC-2 type transport system permease protein
MNTFPNDAAAVANEPRESAPEAVRPTRPFYWSVRRELWEHRWLYLAPLAVAALVLFASVIGAFSLPRKMRSLTAADPAKVHAALVTPGTMAPAPIILATFLFAFFYCFEALHGERRDRSILFWKSLPVSDRTTVLSKAAIPMIVLPAIGFVLGALAQLFLLFFSTAVLLASHVSAAPLWAELRFVQEPLILLYGLTAHVLWFAPVYGWFLLVSAWAKRTPFLWAVLPVLMLAAFERIAFHTAYLGNLLRYRVVGAMSEAFGKHAANGVVDRLSQLDPGRFLTAPGLWLGLFFAAACLGLAVKLRRRREPI